MVAYVVLVFVIQNFYGYIALTLFLCLCVGASKISPKYLIKGLRPILVFIVFTGLFNLCLTSGTPVWSFGILTITREGIRFAAFMVLRLVFLIVGNRPADPDHIAHCADGRSLNLPVGAL